MAARLIEQKAAVDQYCLQHRRDLLLTEQEWSLLEDMTNLLQAFGEWSAAFCKDSASISMQIAACRALTDTIAEGHANSLAEEKALVRHYLTEKFGGLEQYRYRKLPFIYCWHPIVCTVKSF